MKFALALRQISESTVNRRTHSTFTFSFLHSNRSIAQNSHFYPLLALDSALLLSQPLPKFSIQSIICLPSVTELKHRSGSAPRRSSSLMRNAVLLRLLTLLAEARATQITLPTLDLTSLGHVAIAGQFSGASLYQDTQQSEILSTTSSDGLYRRSADGIVTNVAQSNGEIYSVCSLNSSNSEMLYIGGNFSHLGTVAATNIASYNPSTGNFSALSNGVLGTVNALYCDDTDDLVYIGGSFEISNSTNAVVWNVSQQRFSTVAFGGFDGTVNTIQSNGSSILFGGRFDSVAAGNSSSTNEPQQINLQTAYITSQYSTTTTGLSNPNNIVCPSGNDGPGSTWLLSDNQAGSWSAATNFTFRPSSFRIYNTHYEGRGTKEFRFIAEPINGILNLTYTDPTTGAQAYCDARCPLSNTGDSLYQEFKFVNVIEMNAFSIAISAWYGLGAGLDGLEIFTDEINAYAIAGFNDPSCATGTYLSTSSVVGSWTPVIMTGEPGYLAANLSAAALSTDSVTFEPQISERGSYAVRMYTPGCLMDNTCSSRGGVTVSVFAQAGVAATNVTLFQTNNYDKYDTIYQGTVSPATASFRPSVRLTAEAGQSGTVNVVASQVQFIEIDASGSVNLNGIYEFNPSTYSTTTLSNSSFDTIGSDLGLDASVSTVTVIGDSTYVTGNFTGDGIANIVKSQGTAISAPANSGLNAGVITSLLLNDILYLGGNFTALVNSTVSASHIVGFNTTSNTWVPVGAGVNGPVTSLFEFNGTLGVSGPFTVLNAFTAQSASRVSSTATWNPSTMQWSSNAGYIDGTVVDTESFGNYTYLVGNIRDVYQVPADGVVGLVSTATSEKLAPVSLPVYLDSVGVPSYDINAGTFYNTSTLSLTILGGHFTTVDSNNDTISNVAILTVNGTVTGLPPGSLDTSSTVYAVHVDNQKVLIGGNLSGVSGTSTLGGLLIYDPLSGSLDSVQPAALQGTNVQVNTITSRPNVAQIVVGGNFDSAGSLTCPSLCVLDRASTTWQRPAIGLTGNVSYSTWLGQDILLLAGNMTLNGTTQYLATFDFKSQTFSPVTKSLLPGPALVAVSDTNTTGSIYVAGTSTNGSAYLAKWNGNTTIDLTPGLSTGSSIYALQFFPLTKKSASTNSVMSSNRNLLVMGSLNLTGNGTVSGALFDGADYTPYLLTNTAASTPGSVRTLFSDQQISFSSSGSGLSRGAIVAISLAIAFFITSATVVCGLLAAWLRRRREGYRPATQTIPGEKSGPLPGTTYGDDNGNFQSFKGARI